MNDSHKRVLYVTFENFVMTLFGLKSNLKIINLLERNVSKDRDVIFEIIKLLKMTKIA